MRFSLQTRDNKLMVSAVIEANDGVTVGTEYHEFFPLRDLGIDESDLLVEEDDEQFSSDVLDEQRPGDDQTTSEDVDLDVVD